MVLREASGGWYLVTQPDHARLAGELARHWKHPKPPAIRDPEFLEAVSLHDAGWEPIDRQPIFAEGAKPVSFLEAPLTLATDAWRRSIGTARALGTRAAYLITRHFCVLGRMSISRPLPAAERSALECFLAEFEVQSLDPTLEDWLRLLQVCDLLSLQLLTAGKMNLNLMSNQGIEARFDTSTESLLLSPFPFDSPLKLECPARFLTADSRIPVQSDPLRFKVCAAANHGGYGCTDGRL